MATLYRLYDRDGQLLYIGKTGHSVRARIRDHLRKPWGHTIDHHTEEAIPAGVQPIRAEARAISLERPLHNIYQTERAPVRGRRSNYGRCPVCQSTRPVGGNGSLKDHWSAGVKCEGSRMIPEALENVSGTATQVVRTSRARADQGAWNRDQGTVDVGPKVPSIVKVSSARARDAWMGLRR